jgi:hypothetical protein
LSNPINGCDYVNASWINNESNKTEKTEKAEKAQKTENTKKAKKTEKTEKSQKTENTDNTEKTEKTDNDLPTFIAAQALINLLEEDNLIYFYCLLPKTIQKTIIVYFAKNSIFLHLS